MTITQPQPDTEPECRGEVDVYYVVPVCVTVDLDSGEVVRVVVDDEAIRKPSDAMPPYVSAPPTDEEADAYDVAESHPWPGWGFGY